MTTVRELPHTADVGFEVRAPTLEELFAGAARGLVTALGTDSAEGTAGGASESLHLHRPDLDRLLVHWLRELLARASARGEVPRVQVEEVEVEEMEATGAGDEARLRAAVDWLPATSDPTREIKGVTYHGLAVERDGQDWHARVVLDV